MGEILERIYGVLFQPTDTLRDISRQEPLQHSLIVIVFVTLLTTWTGYFTILGRSAAVFGTLIITLVMWLSGSAIAHLAAELLGGTGRSKGLLCANGFIQLPRIFTVPLLVASFYLPAVLQKPLLIIVGSGLFIWEFVLGLIAIRECYGFSTGRAFLTAIAPYLVVLLPLIALTFIAATVLVKALTLMGSGDMLPMFMK